MLETDKYPASSASGATIHRDETTLPESRSARGTIWGISRVVFSIYCFAAVVVIAVIALYFSGRLG